MQQGLKTGLIGAAISLGCLGCLGTWYWVALKPSDADQGKAMVLLSQTLVGVIANADVDLVNQSIDAYPFPIIIMDAEKEILSSNLSKSEQKSRVTEAKDQLKLHKDDLEGPIDLGKNQGALYYKPLSHNDFDTNILVMLALSLLAGGSFAAYYAKTQEWLGHQAYVVDDLNRQLERRKTGPLQREVRALEEKTKKISSMLLKARKKIENEDGTRQKIREEWKEKIQQLEADVQSLETQNHRQQDKIAHLEQNNVLLKHQVEKYQKQVSELKTSQVTTVAAKPKAQTVAIKSTENKAKQRVQEIRQIQSAHANVVSQQKDQEHKHRDLMKQIRKKESDLNAIKKKEQELQLKEEQLRAKPAEQQSENDKKIQQELKIVRQQLTHKMHELQGLNQEYEQSVKRLKEIMEEKVRVENDLLTMEDHLDAMTSEFQALAEERDMLQEERLLLAQQLDDLSQSDQASVILKKEETTRRFQDENKKLYNAMQHMQQRVAELEAQLQEAQQKSANHDGPVPLYSQRSLADIMSPEFPTPQRGVVTDELPDLA